MNDILNKMIKSAMAEFYTKTINGAKCDFNSNRNLLYNRKELELTDNKED